MSGSDKRDPEIYAQQDASQAVAGRSIAGFGRKRRKSPTRTRPGNGNFQYEHDIPRIPANVLVAAIVAVYVLQSHFTNRLTADTNQSVHHLHAVLLIIFHVSNLTHRISDVTPKRHVA
jgi:hypothetical protein